VSRAKVKIISEVGGNLTQKQIGFLLNRGREHIKLTNILTSVVGGHRDGDLISVDNDCFDSVDSLPLRFVSNPNECFPNTINFTRYRREMLGAYFNGRYYARHFFVRNETDIEKAKYIYNQYFKMQLSLFINKR